MITTENYYEYAQALYWYCVAEHAGQNCPLYSILSQLHYTPSLTEREDDADEFIWDSFQEGLSDPEEVFISLQDFI